MMYDSNNNYVPAITVGQPSYYTDVPYDGMNYWVNIYEDATAYAEAH